MGNTMKWQKPAAVRKEGTTLVEIAVPHIREAHDVIGLQPEEYTPVTLVPLSSNSEFCGCPVCWFSIPSGFSALVSRFGADIKGDMEDGTWAPGFHCNHPCACLRVSRLVCKNLIIFDTPVKDCKTKDNITVNIDVLMVLEITDAKTFVYHLGPEKLDALLRASQEEVLRQVAYTIPVENIYDLHGTNTDEWVKEMNQSFKTYGVTIHHFTVENVTIPSDMAQDFEDKTLYESKTKEKKMQQESDTLKLNHDEAREKLNQECDNAKMAAEEQAVTTKAQLVKEVREVLASTEKELVILNAQKDAAVADVNATTELEVAKTKAEITTTRRESQAKVDAEADKVGAEAEAYQEQKKATGKMEAARKIALGKKALAESEGAATDAFAPRRAQEKEMARLDILAGLAKNSAIRIATSRENNMGLAPDNSLVSQVAQQGLEALRMKLADLTAASSANLNLGSGQDMRMELAGGLVRPVPQQKMAEKMV